MSTKEFDTVVDGLIVVNPETSTNPHDHALVTHASMAASAMCSIARMMAEHGAPAGAMLGVMAAGFGQFAGGVASLAMRHGDRCFIRDQDPAGFADDLARMVRANTLVRFEDAGIETGVPSVLPPQPDPRLQGQAAGSA